MLRRFEPHPLTGLQFAVRVYDATGTLVVVDRLGFDSTGTLRAPDLLLSEPDGTRLLGWLAGQTLSADHTITLGTLAIGPLASGAHTVVIEAASGTTPEFGDVGIATIPVVVGATRPARAPRLLVRCGQPQRRVLAQGDTLECVATTRGDPAAAVYWLTDAPDVVTLQVLDRNRVLITSVAGGRARVYAVAQTGARMRRLGLRVTTVRPLVQRMATAVLPREG